MPSARTSVEILNGSLQKVAEIRNLYPLNSRGMVLRYSKELSDFGDCHFRVRSHDPVLASYGDILKPHAYHVRLKRGGVTVWQGAIIDNPQRTKDFIEVKAAEYEYYLDKILVRRTSNNPITGGADGNFRIFNGGTMAAAVSSLISDAVADVGSHHPLSGLTVGTIENPNYPLGFSDANGVALSGGWNFSSFIQLQFDYHSLYYVLKSFGSYVNCDFTVDKNLQFQFKKFLGNKLNPMTFEYGRNKNIVDYNLPRLGRRMVNDLWGVATDGNGKILHAEQTDSASLNTYGKLEDVVGFSDVKDVNFLKARINQDLQFTATPETAPVNILLNEKGYPLGQYDIGDIITVKINDNVIAYQAPRRIVGITVNLHDTGREMTTVQTNTPRPEDIGA
jgi:hypothetical protein